MTIDKGGQMEGRLTANKSKRAEDIDVVSPSYSSHLHPTCILMHDT